MIYTVVILVDGIIFVNFQQTVGYHAAKSRTWCLRGFGTFTVVLFTPTVWVADEEPGKISLYLHLPRSTL